MKSESQNIEFTFWSQNQSPAAVSLSISSSSAAPMSEIQKGCGKSVQGRWKGKAIQFWCLSGEHNHRALQWNICEKSKWSAVHLVDLYCTLNRVASINSYKLRVYLRSSNREGTGVWERSRTGGKILYPALESQESSQEFNTQNLSFGMEDIHRLHVRWNS